MMRSVVVIGSGVVGTATGKGLSAGGHEVAFVDSDPARVDELRSEGCTAGTRVELGGTEVVVFLTVPTPVRDGRFVLDALEGAARAVAEAMLKSTAHCTVVVRSTTPPGTCDRVVQPIIEEMTGLRCGDGFSLVCSPEFLRAATAFDDFVAPRLTLIGSREPAAVERLMWLFAPFGGRTVTTDDPVAAELIKCLHNAFNATKISFWNEAAAIARALGVDSDLVAETVAFSAEASYNPAYGIRGGAAFRGCLAKDTEGLIGVAQQSAMPTALLEAVMLVNDALSRDEQG